MQRFGDKKAKDVELKASFYFKKSVLSFYNINPLRAANNRR